MAGWGSGRYLPGDETKELRRLAGGGGGETLGDVPGPAVNAASYGGGGVVLRPAGTLSDRAQVLLAAGPMSTAMVAERVLALRGHPRAAAAAVFALLGSDPRFSVDRQGVWSLAVQATGGWQPLRSEDWAVVDVETTGGSPARGHRVIEIAAVRVSGHSIVGHFSTLVDPGCAIPRVITQLTGIDDVAVRQAPRFADIGDALTEALRGRVFVGHNAGFDWRFVCAELELCTGHTLIGRRLCTLRLARRLLPHLPSRSLGALAHYFGIRMERHHRALDDADATARLLLHLLDELDARGISDWSGLEAFLRGPRIPRPPRRIAHPRSMDAA